MRGKIMSSTERFLNALQQQGRGREKLLLKIGLWIAIFAGVLSSVGIYLAPKGLANPIGTGIALFISAWFAFRLATFDIEWLSRPAHIFGWVMNACAPNVYIIAYGIYDDPVLAITAWAPAQLIVILIAASMTRLITWVPLVVATFAGLTYFLAFAFLKLHVTLEVAAYDAFSWRAGAFRACALVFWGCLASLVVRQLRRVIGYANDAIRAEDLFGKYQIGEIIGAGGMGEVCRGTYCPEGGFVSEVAIKRIHPRFVDDPSIVDRFRKEAELGARLRHHNIVATLDFGRMDATYFLAMEYVDGEPLRALTRKAKQFDELLPARFVAYVGQELLAGLHFSHEVATAPSGERLRLIHRDICPNNILVTRSGHVKIADFGVAHALLEDDSFTAKQVVGKIGYLSPEAVRGDPVDARGDLFAVGCILWELATGRRAFKDKDTAQALKRLVSGDTDTAPGRDRLSLPWRAFLEKALASRPEDRFQSAREMAIHLHHLVPMPASPEEFAVWQRNLGQDTKDINTDEYEVLARAPTSPRKAAPGSMHSIVPPMVFTSPISHAAAAAATELGLPSVDDIRNELASFEEDTLHSLKTKIVDCAA